MTSNHYHKEIDGLRAISVIVIILFHLKVAAFAGGFIGVDIFFVVSGYLITQIILSNLNASQFTFKDFYVRRTTRILPALIAMVLVMLPLAMYVQQPAALVHTAWETVYALFSVSNFYFWTEASYWAPSSDKYVLLHTWSLGVEEQFYLVYPLLLVLCHRFAGNRGVIVLLFVILVAGTVASEVTLQTDRSAAFFFTPLRFYEFALGGLGATLASYNPLQRSPPVAAAATLLGLGMIFYGALVFNGLLPLPGVTMLIPAGGALLILLAGASLPARILLMNPLMSWLGKVSYSLYLTHWPLIVFYRYYFGPNLSLWDMGVLLVTIVASAALLNRTVERRFRLAGADATASGIPARKVLWGILTAIIIACAISAALIQSKGWPSRMPQEAKELLKIHPRLDTRKNIKYLDENCLPKGEVFCGEHKPDTTNIMLLGDSRALDMYYALTTAYPDASIRVSYAMGCPPVFNRGIGWSPFYPACPQLNTDRLQAALEAPSQDIVFMALNISQWSAAAVLETVLRLRKAGKTVYVLGPFNFLERIPPPEIAVDLLRFHSDGDGLANYLIDEPFGFDGEFATKIRAAGAVYVSNRDFFYDGEYHFTDRETGKFLTNDGVHLSRFGAEQFGLYMRKRYPLPFRPPLNESPQQSVP